MSGRVGVVGGAGEAAQGRGTSWGVLVVVVLLLLLLEPSSSMLSGGS